VTKLNDVCRYIRSKNAGPFWITVDLFFDGAENYSRYGATERLTPALFAELFGADPALVKRTAVDDLQIVKFSYPRAKPQGGVVERDMHGGQQFVRLLDVALD
jgi:hypothetical protein